ncbi:hypothetical protein CDAR_539281 [Caerostris darwini]|uniref:Uncharacterized protein n=1 Tax=Caerostris darwini TaxID=1538125 RepID=A0AAV4T6P0_9ARAC|nr:hypothetical protein CDAR_539281 [Caerostris darwini]
MKFAMPPIKLKIVRNFFKTNFWSMAMWHVCWSMAWLSGAWHVCRPCFLMANENMDDVTNKQQGACADAGILAVQESILCVTTLTVSAIIVIAGFTPVILVVITHSV